MNNKVVFAAAGNGKTYSICEQAKDIVENQNCCVLLISYTNEGIHSLEKEYRKQNEGILPENNVSVHTRQGVDVHYAYAAS